jgi:hypothetical protein
VFSGLPHNHTNEVNVVHTHAHHNKTLFALKPEKNSNFFSETIGTQGGDNVTHHACRILTCLAG